MPHPAPCVLCGHRIANPPQTTHPNPLPVCANTAACERRAITASAQAMLTNPQAGLLPQLRSSGTYLIPAYLAQHPHYPHVRRAARAYAREHGLTISCHAWTSTLHGPVGAYLCEAVLRQHGMTARLMLAHIRATSNDPRPDLVALWVATEDGSAR